MEYINMIIQELHKKFPDYAEIQLDDDPLIYTIVDKRFNRYNRGCFKVYYHDVNTAALTYTFLENVDLNTVRVVKKA